MQSITVKPVAGRLVRDPVTGREITEPTPVDGDDPFWIRRLADGDVQEDAGADTNNLPASVDVAHDATAATGHAEEQ
ncbi:DUF2635 domain-containing protein [Ralstonia pseudosolanacearum]|uniref:DUF2635 domain-containing protein n=1 Tax=Ralstonia pseudosolanacearum TaxID=1310165 RepID=UPI000E9893FE|nr:DUF2635 domain-containing protein [Ralstonia pseudosolanacearum]AXW48125.1 hypothetical protein CJO91_10685 [Ralstonia solanacearum]NKA36060.1 hypothetical protein [Ralstonia solanacearum]NKA95324.1 hypothetical protein [Ralstonia solanacearum]BEU51596.1 hypothetical protein MAFF211520_18880 [Ralstonia pseudosolanacearum]BEU56837.1 hypothetical protein MAFF211521_18900 [Ralstonia pseudosolanacearum]